MTKNSSFCYVAEVTQKPKTIRSNIIITFSFNQFVSYLPTDLIGLALSRMMTKMQSET